MILGIDTSIGTAVAIIADERNFYGLITQVDLIDHLRKTMHDDGNGEPVHA